MSAHDDTRQHESFDAEEGDFVPAFFARTIEEAEEYCELLGDHDIPARCGLDDAAAEGDSEQRTAKSRGMTRGVPVLVPEQLLDEASEIIAEREEFSDFDEQDDEDEEEEEEEEEADEDEFGLDDLEEDEEEDEEDEFLEDEEDDGEEEEGDEEDEEDEEDEDGDGEGLFGDEGMEELEEDEKGDEDEQA